MKKIKLTEVQKFRLHNALREAASMLSTIKLSPLKGDALKDMKILEQGVQHLECFLLGK